MSEFLEKRGIAPHPGLPRGYLSFSQISKYLRCAMSYKFHYIDNTPFVGGIALTLGKTVHEVIEYAHKAQIAGEVVPISTLLNVTMNTAVDMLAHEPWDEEEEALDGLQCAAVACVTAWWRQFGEQCQPVASEEEIIYMFEDHEGRPVPVLGYVDLRHMEGGREEILDYKTTARKKTQSFVDENLQLWLYSIMTGCRDVGIASIVRPKGYVGHCQPNALANFEIKRSRVSGAQQLHARNIVKDVVAGISANYFPRCAPGEWNCSTAWCNYFESCRGALQPFYVPPQGPAGSNPT